VFQARPKTHRIEICTGFINGKLKEALRKKSYDVRVVEITGLLQDKLEGLFKQYIKHITGQDLAYDPKEIKKEDIPRYYYKVLDWGKKNAPHLLKSGWKSMS
jgi:phage-related protein